MMGWRFDRAALPALVACASILAACSSDGDTTLAVASHGPGANQGGSTTTSGAGGGAPTACVPTSPVAECRNDAECDDGDPSTADRCESKTGGEFPTGTCVHAACDGGADCVTQAVDPTCSVGESTVVSPPFVPLAPPDVPKTCASGFQATDAKAKAGTTYVLDAKTKDGSRAITLDLDLATYTAPDGVQVTGVDAQCKKYVLFDSCRLRTADEAESQYTDGKHRPDDVAIRQYRVEVREGTRQLTFDFGRVVSPMYLRVLGLCDFDVTDPPAGSFKWFEAVP